MKNTKAHGYRAVVSELQFQGLSVCFFVVCVVLLGVLHTTPCPSGDPSAVGKFSLIYLKIKL